MELSIIQEVNTKHKAVAITFDDGPNPEYTPQILDIFREHNAKATFYVIGEHVTKYPEIAQAAYREGHELGNHTFTHPALTKLNPEERKKELEATERCIQEVTGEKAVTFRPPYLDFNEEVAELVERMGYPTIGAVNMGAQDWDQPGVDHILRETRSQVRPGSILIFHDGYGNRSQTVSAVRTLVPELVEQGYRLVTVRELLALEERDL
jgi:peptidoglycan-N-acetylglucosamine deacetylase